MRENRTSGSVRGMPRKGHIYLTNEGKARQGIDTQNIHQVLSYCNCRNEGKARQGIAMKRVALAKKAD